MSAHPGNPRAVGTISCLRADRPAHSPQVEDVTLEFGLGRVLFTFNDGMSADFDLAELLAQAGEDEVGRLRAA